MQEFKYFNCAKDSDTCIFYWFTSKFEAKKHTYCPGRSRWLRVLNFSNKLDLDWNSKLGWITNLLAGKSVSAEWMAADFLMYFNFRLLAIFSPIFLRKICEWIAVFCGNFAVFGGKSRSLAKIEIHQKVSYLCSWTWFSVKTKRFIQRTSISIHLSAPSWLRMNPAKVSVWFQQNLGIYATEPIQPFIQINIGPGSVVFKNSTRDKYIPSYRKRR